MSLLIYTDGSCYLQDKEQPGGWAYAIIRDSEIIQSAKGQEFNTTNNRMEVRAALEGLKAAEDLKDRGAPTVITDSQFLVNSVTIWFQSKHARRDPNATPGMLALDEMIVEIKERSLRLGVEFAWIKGHSGDLYNEFVDTLAGDARRGYL